MLNYEEAKPKPITNYDRLRAKSVEELARWLSKADPECDPPDWWLDWLKEEATDGNHDH